MPHAAIHLHKLDMLGGEIERERWEYYQGHIVLILLVLTTMCQYIIYQSMLILYKKNLQEAIYDVLTHYVNMRFTVRF